MTQPTPTGLLERLPPAMPCLLVFLLTLLLYSSALGFTFLNLDDTAYVTENALVRAGLTLEGVRTVFTEPQVSNWHPITMLSHMADVELFGLDPAGHHGTSIVLHAVNGALLYLLLYLGTGRRLPALLVALLFAVHPTHVESVAWISERKDVLSTLFLLLAMIAHLRIAAPVPRLVVVTLTVALGLMSKAMLVTAPLVFLLLDLWPLKRFELPQRGEALGPWLRGSGVLRCLLEKIPLVLLSLGVTVMTLLAQTRSGSVHELALGTRIENALVSYARYLLKLIRPTELAAFYPHEGAPSLGALLASLGVLATISLLALLQARARPYLLVGWLFFLGTLLPVIGLVQIGVAALADRYLYIPSIGILVAATWAWFELGRFVDRRLLLLPPLLLVALFTFQTLTYLPSWQYSVSVWKRVLIVNDPAYLPFIEDEQGTMVIGDQPYGLALPYFAMGEALLDIGLNADARTHFRIAVAIDPKNPRLRKRIGMELFEAGRLEAARARLQEVRALGASDPNVEATLAEIERRLGEAH